MPKKKTVVSGFTMLMKEMQEKRFRDTGNNVGMQDIIHEAEPIWRDMSAEKKMDYNCRAKAYKKDMNQGYKKLASDGTTVEGNMLLEREAEERNKQMAQDIQQFIGLFQNTGLVQDVAKKHIYLISTNILVATEEGDRIPIEIGVAQYSLRSGIMNVYHKIINPGPPPAGYAGQAKIHSEDTHKLLSEEKIALKKYGESNIYNIWKEIYSFISPSAEELPPLYCLKDFIKQNHECLNWILRKAGDPDHISNRFQIWDLAQLVSEMRCAVDKKDSSKTSAITYFHATEMLKKNTFDYEPNTRCEFHEDIDSPFCALGHVRRLCFLMSDILCDVYDVLKTDKHLPCSKEHNFCEVYNPCKNESKDFLEVDIPEQIASQAADSTLSSCSKGSRSSRDDSHSSLRQPHISPSTFCQLKNKTSITSEVQGIGRGRVQK